MFTNLKLNFLSLISIIGIWPRFIEPKLLCTTKIDISLASLKSSPNKSQQQALDGIKILQLSDLHLNQNLSDRFLHRIIDKANALKPDIIVFTGDFICHGSVTNKERLTNFLKSFSAPYGCYAVFGNHDYSQYVSINSAGDYDVIPVKKNSSSLNSAFKRLFKTIRVTGNITPCVKRVPLNQELISVLQESSITLLNNKTISIQIGKGALNITGVGEYSLGRCNPESAFNINIKAPSVVLLHNPDGINLLKNFPADIILSGHTHGGQVNLPWIWKKLTLLENPLLKKGLFKRHHQWHYVNRGISGILPFRFFSPPELLLLTLKK